MSPSVEGSWLKEGLCGDLLLCSRGVQFWDPPRDPQGQQGSLGGAGTPLGVGYRPAGHQGQRGEWWDSGAWSSLDKELTASSLQGGHGLPKALPTNMRTSVLRYRHSHKHLRGNTARPPGLGIMENKKGEPPSPPRPCSGSRHSEIW